MMSRKKRACAPQGVSQEEVQPWHRLGGVEHICELRKNAQVLYAIFASILRMLYSSKRGRTFGCPDVQWKPDPQKTSIWIDTELRWEDQRPDFTPAIYVSLGEMAYSGLPSIDMQYRTIMSHDGERHYERTVTGSASIIHVSDRAGAACSLADNTENYLSSLQDQICDEYCFDHFTVAARMPRQKKERPETDGKGKYSSVVAVKFDYTDAWTVKLETPILKEVSLMDEGSAEIKVVDTMVEVPTGDISIEAADLSAETDTPLDN